MASSSPSVSAVVFHAPLPLLLLQLISLGVSISNPPSPAMIPSDLAKPPVKGQICDTPSPDPPDGRPSSLGSLLSPAKRPPPKPPPRLSCRSLWVDRRISLLETVRTLFPPPTMMDHPPEDLVQIRPPPKPNWDGSDSNLCVPVFFWHLLCVLGDNPFSGVFCFLLCSVFMVSVEVWNKVVSLVLAEMSPEILALWNRKDSSGIMVTIINVIVIFPSIWSSIACVSVCVFMIFVCWFWSCVVLLSLVCVKCVPMVFEGKPRKRHVMTEMIFKDKAYRCCSSRLQAYEEEAQNDYEAILSNYRSHLFYHIHNSLVEFIKRQARVVAYMLIGVTAHIVGLKFYDKVTRCNVVWIMNGMN